MDYEVIPRPCNVCVVVEFVQEPLWFTPRKKIVKVTMEFEIPKRHIQGVHFSTNMIQRVLQKERQKRCHDRKRQRPMVDKYFYNKILRKVLWGREDKEKTIDQICFQKCPFWAHMKKSQHIHFLMHGHFSWSMVDLHIVRSPTAL